MCWGCLMDIRNMRDARAGRFHQLLCQKTWRCICYETGKIAGSGCPDGSQGESCYDPHWLWLQPDQNYIACDKAKV